MGRLGSVVAMVVLLVIGGALVSALPSPDDVRNRPFEFRASVGQDVSTRAATYQVVTVQGARSVVSDDFSKSETTSLGLMLVITIWHAGITGPSTIVNPQILDTQGRLYSAVQSTQSNCSLGQPVLGEACEAIIEVSPDALAGSQLRLPAQRYSDGEHDEVAVIDLGITQQQVDEWLSRTTPLSIGPSRPGRP